MSARKTKQKRKEALDREKENARRNKADQAAKRADAQRAADSAEVERLIREATDSVKRAQAEKDFGKLVETQPAHKRPIIEATAPPLLRLSTAKGKLVGQAGSQAPDLIGLGYYLTALYKSAHNSQFASNGNVTADIAAVLSQIPDNQYAYISFRQVDSIEYVAPFVPDDGSIASLGIFDDHTVAVNRIFPHGDPDKLKIILVQGQAHLGLVMESVYSGPDAQQGLRPITPELAKQLNDELDERRKAREAHDPQPAPTDAPSAEPAPITGIPEPVAPMWRGLPPPLGAPPKVGVDGTLLPAPDWTVPQPNAPLVPRPEPAPTPPQPPVRQLRASAGPSDDHQALSARYRELIASVVAQGHHPPAIPPHPETGLPSVARALVDVEAKLRKAAKNDEEVRSEGLKTIAGLLASCDAEMRPRLHTRNWLVDDDAYVDLLCSGHWRATGEHPQLGDIVWLAEPAVPGGGRVGIALEEDASQWLTTDFYGHLHITHRAPGAAVKAAWQPLDRDVFNPDQQIGAVWNAKRWRAMLTDCYGVASASAETIVGHIAQAAGVPGVTDPVELSGHLRGELWACRPGVPLWPGAIVFGREAGDVGVLLPDGDALGTSAVNRLPGQVLPMALQRFQPRFIWYPRPS
jgi:hypothetical protein